MVVFSGGGVAFVLVLFLAGNCRRFIDATVVKSLFLLPFIRRRCSRFSCLWLSCHPTWSSIMPRMTPAWALSFTSGLLPVPGGGG